MTDTQVRQCPRCGATPYHPFNVVNAVSRKDNRTRVCTSCGTDEAMLNFRFGRDADVWPGYPGLLDTDATPAPDSK